MLRAQRTKKSKLSRRGIAALFFLLGSCVLVLVYLLSWSSNRNAKQARNSAILGDPKDSFHPKARLHLDALESLSKSFDASKPAIPLAVVSRDDNHDHEKYNLSLPAELSSTDPFIVEFRVAPHGGESHRDAKSSIKVRIYPKWAPLGAARLRELLDEVNLTI